jgi:hypothetical protein
MRQEIKIQTGLFAAQPASSEACSFGEPSRNRSNGSHGTRPAPVALAANQKETA